MVDLVSWSKNYIGMALWMDEVEFRVATTSGRSLFEPSRLLRRQARVAETRIPNNYAAIHRFKYFFASACNEKKRGPVHPSSIYDRRESDQETTGKDDWKEHGCS